MAILRGAMAGMATAIACFAIPAAAASIDPVEVDAAIDATVARYDLPGIAVGIVADGEVAHVRRSARPSRDRATR